MKVLITAGPVYGRLDDNKLVSNRSRGIWAGEYALRQKLRGHDVTVMVPDTFQTGEALSRVNVVRHKGFDEYREICKRLAPEMDVAIMAAAVVNWIPAEPVKGKMATEGYKTGDRINVPFYLAPRVIEEMKVANPNLTLVGCKMTSGADHETLIEAAYHTLVNSHANVVLANDLQSLRTKHLVYQDRSVVSYEGDFARLFDALDAVLADVHYKTDLTRAPVAKASPEALSLFDRITSAHRPQFTKRAHGSDRVFGAVLVRDGDGYLVSPREKGHMFTSADATRISKIEDRIVRVEGPNKATLNAPLLVRVADMFQTSAVLHLHEHLPDVPTVPYGPPGTVRDNEREIPGPKFNIEGHGFIEARHAK